MAMTSSVVRVEAEARTSSPDSGRRIEWTAAPLPGNWQPVCGYLYNDTPVVPREVRLLLEARDSSGQVVDFRAAHVLGYIAPWGRTSFCSAVAAGASRHSNPTRCLRRPSTR